MCLSRNIKLKEQNQNQHLLLCLEQSIFLVKLRVTYNISFIL